LTPIEAGRLGKELEPYHLSGSRSGSGGAAGEFSVDPAARRTRSRWAKVQFGLRLPATIQEQLIDYIRTTVVHAGGISHLRKICEPSGNVSRADGIHGATDMSPVCMAAALHFDLRRTQFRNSGIHAALGRRRIGVFPHAYAFTDGVMHPGDKPGPRRGY